MGIYALTGGATGIGAAIKQQLVDAGHQLISIDIKDADIIADLSHPEGRQGCPHQCRGTGLYQHAYDRGSGTRPGLW